MSDIAVGLYGSKNYQGGVYNILSSFIAGFHDALIAEGIEAKFINEFLSEGKSPNITLSFNACGVDAWKSTIDRGIPHIMWGVDSPFWHLSTLRRFENCKHFIYAAVSPVDRMPMNYFFPDASYIYLPHGFDPKIWFDDGSEKLYDLVFMSSMTDFEADLETFKAQIDSNLFKIFMEMQDYALRNPDIAFWEIYNIFAELYSFNLNELSLYYIFFLNMCYLVTYKRRVELVKSLSQSNLKVWGSPQWEKYIEGNTEYMGSANLFEAADIVRKSKIVIHLQPMQTLLGFHERVINAMASNALVLADYNPQFKVNFADNIVLYDKLAMQDLPDRVSYYLRSEDERTHMSNTARDIVLQNHTWQCRVQSLMKIILGN